MDTATIAQGLRVTAALIDLASHTLVLGIEQFADRLHPPALVGYVGFDTSPDSLGPVDSADGYFVETGERA